MTYDPHRPVLDGNRGMHGRILDELLCRGRRRAHRDENAEIARLLGCDEHHVAVTRCAWNRGHLWASCTRNAKSRGGKAVWPQPDSLTARLIALESSRVGLSRQEQAAILGTTCGMVRDTAYRIRLRRPDLAPNRREKP